MTPADGATAVSAGVAPNATFSEQIDPERRLGGRLRVVGRAAGPVGSDGLVRLGEPNGVPHAGGAAHARRVVHREGRGAVEAGVRDLAGNALSADVSWSFSVRTCPCTIWPSSAQPGIASSSDAGAVELGLRLRADIAGWISGVRFYKGAGNGGTHVGSLWSNSGTLPGARDVHRRERLRLAAGQLRRTCAGLRGDDVRGVVLPHQRPLRGQRLGVRRAGVDASLLHALRDGLDGASGVYRYSSQPTFPDQTFQSSNYWVDVVFETSQPGDTLPPSVASMTPARGATDVPVNTTVAVTFSEPMDAASINSSTVELRDGATSVAGNGRLRSRDADRDADAVGRSWPRPTRTPSGFGWRRGLRDTSREHHLPQTTWTFTLRAYVPARSSGSA